MEVIDSERSELHIRRLKTILGNEWCSAEIAEYREFREKYSPKDLWSHRLPASSPIVPLLYQHEYVNHRRNHPDPLGYWYGDPIHLLRQLSASIFFFEDYWSKLPNDIGVNNIRYKLSTPAQFNGFLFELIVAVDSKLNRYKDYEVEPLFFDPRTIEGGADIVLRKGVEEIAIQCKTRSPVSSLDMPFDLFHYLFGCLHRLVQDSGYSYKMGINLKQKIEIDDVDAILRQLKTVIASGLEITKFRKDSSFDIELSRLDIPLGGLSKAQVAERLEQDRANLFTEIGGYNPYQANASTFTRIALLSVSSTKYESLGRSIVRMVKQAANETRVNSPLILAIHLYGFVKWEDYLRNPTSRQRLRRGLDTILKSYPRIKYVNVSSNRQEYIHQPTGAEFLETPYLEITNQYFATPASNVDDSQSRKLRQRKRGY